MNERLFPTAFRLLLVCGLLLLGLGTPGCDRASGDSTTATARVSQAKHQGDGPVSVTCTVGMIADVVRNIGGERVEVTALMGPGTDPHLYNATSGDRKALARSDIIFYCGHHLEGKMGEVLESFARKVPTVAVCERVDSKELLSDKDSPEVVDPHLWFDVVLWMRCTEILRDELSRFDPDSKDLYDRLAGDYLKKLEDLHLYVTKRAAEIPEKRRVLVTAHDAFQYFGHAYGIEVLGIQGLSTDSEPAVQKINELVGVIVERGVPAVFVESTISEKNVRSLIEGCNAKGHELKIGGSLYSDAMGATDSAAGTYIGMVRHNIDTIVDALR